MVPDVWGQGLLLVFHYASRLLSYRGCGGDSKLVRGHNVELARLVRALALVLGNERIDGVRTGLWCMDIISITLFVVI